MNVLYIEPGKEPRAVEIDGGLQSMQQLVGGMIEPFYPFPEEVAIVCNEEGKMNGMELNRAIYDDNQRMIEIMAGPFFICGRGEESFTSLTPEQMEKYSKQFKDPETFVRFGGEIVAIPYEQEKRPDKSKPTKPNRDDGAR